MLVNSAIRCIVIVVIPAIYQFIAPEFGGKDYQAVKCWHQVQNILSRSAMTHSFRIQQVSGKVTMMCFHTYLQTSFVSFVIKDLCILPDGLVLSFIVNEIFLSC